jgi:hypothetical protein
MTRRICFIGNSHLGCVYKVWRAVDYKYPGVSLDFFIERSSGTHPLKIESRGGSRTTIDSLLVLHPEAIEPECYDAFVVSALGFSAMSAAMVYSQYRTLEHRSSPKNFLVSKSAFRSALCGGLRSSKATMVAQAIRSHTDRPIFLLGQPRMSADLMSAHADEHQHYRASLGTADEAVLDAAYVDAAVQVSSSIGAIFVDQPDGTRASPLLTKTHLGFGDFVHMGVIYGHQVLNQVLRAAGCEVQDFEVYEQDGRCFARDRIKGRAFRFSPRSEFGITDRFCRLVLFDNDKGDFCWVQKIPSDTETLVKFGELSGTIDAKFKLQIEEGGKWVDAVDYRPLPKITASPTPTPHERED